MTGLLERCRGLATRDPDQARQHLELALSVQSGQPDPFETARTRLLLGSRLRRECQRVVARPQLESAASAFEGMGLRLWADEAAAELRATGARTGPRTGGSSAALTAQEHRVALLVAEGRSNKEVAAALFLSPRTVERHLGNVFRKRGVRTRAELVRSYVNSGAPRQ
jgi:DNA-binding CsgD family transcriptional regulator